MLLKEVVEMSHSSKSQRIRDVRYVQNTTTPRGTMLLSLNESSILSGSTREIRGFFVGGLLEFGRIWGQNQYLFETRPFSNEIGLNVLLCNHTEYGKFG